MNSWANTAAVVVVGGGAYLYIHVGFPKESKEVSLGVFPTITMMVMVRMLVIVVAAWGGLVVHIRHKL